MIEISTSRPSHKLKRFDNIDNNVINIEPGTYGSQISLDQLREIGKFEPHGTSKRSCLLQLDKFGLPLNLKDKHRMMNEFIKNIENNILKQNDFKNAIRNQSILLI